MKDIKIQWVLKTNKTRMLPKQIIIRLLKDKEKMLNVSRKKDSAHMEEISAVNAT